MAGVRGFPGRGRQNFLDLSPRAYRPGSAPLPKRISPPPGHPDSPADAQGAPQARDGGGAREEDVSAGSLAVRHGRQLIKLVPFMPLQQLPFKRDEGLRKGALPPLAHTQAWSGPGWVCVYPNLKILYPRAAVKYPPLSHPRAYHKLTPLMLSPSRALPSHI